MKKLELNEDSISKRTDMIKRSLERLNDLKPLTPGQFMLDENFAIAEHYLRYALEATFDICGHILSRITGAEVGEYRKMALEMGKYSLVPKDFAEGSLFNMGGYRNRLTHFYMEVTPEEIYNIIQNNLGDFELFLKCVKKLLE